MKKHIITIVLCIAALVAIVYFVTAKNISKTPDTTPATTQENPREFTYTNQTYGFSLILPKDWKNFTIVPGTVQFGETVTLRHPNWSKENPYMDVPILVYPIEQWKKWEATNFEGYPTAAPMGPTERGRNAKYVFATAPRYNYSFAIGWEAVETAIESLKAN